MAETPTTEPAAIRAGDTVTWTKTISDYPATDGWTLKYRAVNSAGKIDITATTSGADYAVALTAATTAAYTAGWYDVVGWVEKGSGPTAERVTVETFRWQVTPDLAAAATYDGRSDARIIYDALLTAYKSAVASRAYVQEYEIAGRRMRFASREEWLRELNFWKAQVAAEDRAAKIAAGQPAGARVLVRF